MPTNSKFGFNILVGGKELPEYPHPEDSSRLLVESVLVSPVTYWLNVKEYSSYSEEIEEQKWPVTPYEIKVFAEGSCPFSMFHVYVDGVRVKKVFLNRGESKVVEGFPENDGSSREFLFSLPRFAEDIEDRVKTERSCRVGKIEVIRHDVTYTHSAMGTHNKSVDFLQANKKDVKDISKNQYTMTTTRQGKTIRNGKPYDKPQSNIDTKPKVQKLSYYNIDGEAGKLRLEYHMTQTLLDWGIRPVRLDWTK